MATEKDQQPILYEMMYILDPELGEDGIERMNGVISERITAGGGTIEKDQAWGIRKLAYEIKKRRDGYYHVLEFRAPGTVPASLAAFFKTQVGILRHLIMKVPKAKILQEQRDVAAAARREAQLKHEEELREARLKREEELREETPPAESPEPSAVEPPPDEPTPAEPVTEEASPTEEESAPTDELPETETQAPETQAEQESAPEITQEEAASPTEPEPTPEAPTT